MGLKGLVVGLLALTALAVAWIAPVAARAQGAEPVMSPLTGPPGGVAPMLPVEPQEQAPSPKEGQAPSLEADRSTNEEAEIADGGIEASAAQTGSGGDEGGSDASLDAEESVGQAAQVGGDGGDRDCPDFSSQQEAQDFFEEQGGPDDDPNRLDADNDGEACEDFFADSALDTGVPRGGVDAGVGADDAAPSSAGLLFPVGLAGVAVAGLLGTTLVLWRRAR